MGFYENVNLLKCVFSCSVSFTKDRTKLDLCMAMMMDVSITLVLVTQVLDKSPLSLALKVDFL